jgi:hypothetical protein
MKMRKQLSKKHSGTDHGSERLIAQHLQQQGVGHTSVDDVNRLHP